ncbi:MAG: hypothetical protein MZV65_53800 [Chromatiales bacterium]|nr:hypothetical protein [Chromatiales bacterium]
MTRGPGSAQLPSAGRTGGDAHRRLVGAQAAQRPGRRRSSCALCETPLGLNPRLAGLKHLNRLEQVLACAEWSDPAIAEGLMSLDGRAHRLRDGGQRVPGARRRAADAARSATAASPA